MTPTTILPWYTVNATQIMAIGKGINTATAIEIAAAVNPVLKARNIMSLRRIRYFLTQTAFETAFFAKWAEDLIYTSKERCAEVWPSRFYFKGVATNTRKHGTLPISIGHGPLNSADYTYNTEKLANEVYANRYGNGNAASGDGFRFRGRGGMHLTFRDNYANASKGCYGDDRLIKNPDSVATYPVGMETAAWFWAANGLEALADKDEFTKMTGVINGSTVTAPERLVLLKTVNSVII